MQMMDMENSNENAGLCKFMRHQHRNACDTLGEGGKIRIAIVVHNNVDAIYECRSSPMTSKPDHIAVVQSISILLLSRII